MPNMHAEDSPTCCPMAKAELALQCTAAEPHVLSTSLFSENTKCLPTDNTLLVQLYSSMQGLTLFLRL